MKKLVFTSVFVLFASVVFAQTTTNPTKMCFTPSPDHALLSSYIMEWWPQAADPTTSQPTQDLEIPISMLTPPPTTGGDICVNLAQLSKATPVGPTFVVRLVSNMAGTKSLRSTPSNPFLFKIPGPATGVKISWWEHLLQSVKPLASIREFVGRTIRW